MSIYNRLERRKPLTNVKGCDDEDEDWLRDRVVVYDLAVADIPEWVDTGLVGPSGEPILRRRRWPVGFHQVWEE